MLSRSIYFLFHDEKAVRHTISELKNSLGLHDDQIHAIAARGHGLFEVPGMTVRTKSAETASLERLLWHLSIVVFTVALIALATSLLAAPWVLAVFLGILVVAAQLSGYLFGNRIPNAQLDRFRTGLERGDIVLQIDVPAKEIERVRNFVYSRYPDARTNISNWHIDAFGL